MEIVPPQPGSDWAEFAEAFLGAEELRNRHAFLARISAQLHSASHLSVLGSRICQVALPELGDAVWVQWTPEGESSATQKSAFRFSEEAGAHREIAPEQQQKFRAFTRGLLSHPEPRRLSQQEISQLSALLPFFIEDALIASCDEEGGMMATFLFAMTRSGRSYTNEQIQWASDLVSLSERGMVRAVSEEQLKDKVNARDRLISVASHELKTPLTALKLMLERMRKELVANGGSFPNRERMDHTFFTIDRTVMRLAQSVNMLFNLSELQTGHVTILKEPCQMTILLRDICMRMEGLMTAAGCRLTVDASEEIEGFFDPRRIEQAIINLLANAAKHAPRSEVKVTLEAASDSVIRIQVSDNGPGIPAESHARIFEAFGRAGDSGRVEGLGLGLFIASGVIQAHGGQLALVSAPEEGARFLIEIPRWQA